MENKMEIWTNTMCFLLTCFQFMMFFEGGHAVCSEEWHQVKGGCVYVSNERSPWEQAKEKCLKKEAQLIKIDNDDLHRSIRDILKTEYSTSVAVFIGLRSKNNVPVWIDGSNVTYSRIEKSMKSVPKDECWGYFQHDFDKWRYEYCAEERRYICFQTRTDSTGDTSEGDDIDVLNIVIPIIIIVVVVVAVVIICLICLRKKRGHGFMSTKKKKLVPDDDVEMENKQAQHQKLIEAQVYANSPGQAEQYANTPLTNNRPDEVDTYADAEDIASSQDSSPMGNSQFPEAQASSGVDMGSSKEKAAVEPPKVQGDVYTEVTKDQSEGKSQPRIHGWSEDDEDDDKPTRHINNDGLVYISVEATPRVPIKNGPIEEVDIADYGFQTKPKPKRTADTVEYLQVDFDKTGRVVVEEETGGPVYSN